MAAETLVTISYVLRYFGFNNSMLLQHKKQKKSEDMRYRRQSVPNWPYPPYSLQSLMTGGEMGESRQSGGWTNYRNYYTTVIFQGSELQKKCYNCYLLIFIVVKVKTNH